MQEKDIKQNIEKLQTFLKKYLLESSFKYKKVNIWHKDLEKKLSPFATSGKNMRGLLVMLSASKKDINTLYLAGALELLHTSFLIHDDIMDQDEKRRGRDSIYIQYKKELKTENNLHYGISQAVSFGDISIFLAFDLLNKINNPNLQKIKSFFIEESISVGLGQMQDVFFGFEKKDPDLNTILDIYKFKTARYSISLPLALGYLTNQNIDKKILRNIISAGEFLGIAFQMKDDYLGIWGDTNNTGKGVLKDVNKNKKTIIKFLLLKEVNKKEKIFIDNIFGKDNLIKNEIKTLYDLLDKYQIKEKHDKIMQNYNQKALNFIKKLPKDLGEVLFFLEKYNNDRTK